MVHGSSTSEATKPSTGFPTAGSWLKRNTNCKMGGYDEKNVIGRLNIEILAEKFW